MATIPTVIPEEFRPAAIGAMAIDAQLSTTHIDKFRAANPTAAL